MKHLTAGAISGMERIARLNLVNSITGIKPANLIGTTDRQGRTNAAIFSSVVHLGSSPACIGFIMRPDTVVRDTLNNIRQTGVYTINHVHAEIAEQAHYTSAKFDAHISEFEACGLGEQYIEGFQAPFVRESRLKIGLSLTEEITIPANGTILIVGSVEHVILPEEALGPDGGLDFGKLGAVGITGLDQYHNAELFARFPYARASELPDFSAPPENGHRKRPDQVVFDTGGNSYDASLKPYATNIGAPAFRNDDLTLWKSISTHKAGSHFRARFEEIRNQYENMVEAARWNEMVYNADFNFEPVIGNTYHLYKGRDGRNFLSLVGPSEWAREHLSSFVFNSERMWVRLDGESLVKQA